MIHTKTKALLLLLSIIFCLYLPALGHDFTNWDDPDHLVDNPIVHSLSLENLKAIFTHSPHRTYIPLTTLSFALEHYVFGLNPFVYHLNNVLFHVMISGLIYCLCLQFGLSTLTAFCAALIFGIHPMHVESVAWVTERKDVLYGFFYLLAMCFYQRYSQYAQKKDFVFSIVCGILSMLAKPMALSLPLILGLMDYVNQRRFSLKLVIEKLIHFVYVIPILWISYQAHARVPGQDLGEAMYIALWTATFYLNTFLFPTVLKPIYSLPKPISFANSAYIYALVSFFIYLGALVYFRRRKWVVWAILFYVFSIFFLIKYDAIETIIVADRYMYLPSLGLCVLGGVILDKVYGATQSAAFVQRAFIGCTVIVVFILLGIKTHTQIQIWQNSYSLWRYAQKVEPNNSTVHNNLGDVYRQKENIDQALNHYGRSIQLNPRLSKAYFNRGQIYFNNKQNYKLALNDFNQAIEIDPHRAEYFYMRGVIYKNKKKYGMALADYDKAIQLKPDYLQAYNNRGVVHAGIRNYVQAIADFDRALAIDPQYREALRNKRMAEKLMNN